MRTQNPKDLPKATPFVSGTARTQHCLSKVLTLKQNTQYVQAATHALPSDQLQAT